MNEIITPAPVLSVIVPCYKVERYLPRCLDSLVNQTLSNIEVICINDGSPDHCIDILRDYEVRYPGKIRVIDKKNEGVWRGRWDGIRLARGEYIGFVDSDDYVVETFAEDLYQAAKNADADIAVCGFNRVDMDTGADLTKEMCVDRPPFSVRDQPCRLVELNGAPWNKVFRASILKNMRDLPFPPPVLDDLMFHLLAYLDMTGKVVFAPKPLVKYMVRSDSIINTVNQGQIDATIDAFAEVKRLYTETGASVALQETLDVMAFLHLGVSFSFRLSYDPNCDVHTYISRCTALLNETFPRWRRAQCLHLGYVLRNRGAFLKLWIVKGFFVTGTMGLFLSIYRFLIDKLHIDIKW